MGSKPTPSAKPPRRGALEAMRALDDRVLGKNRRRASRRDTAVLIVTIAVSTAAGQLLADTFASAHRRTLVALLVVVVIDLAVLGPYYTVTYLRDRKR